MTHDEMHTVLVGQIQAGRKAAEDLLVQHHQTLGAVGILEYLLKTLDANPVPTPDPADSPASSVPPVVD